MSKREMPEPFYAAAGASDLAYQRLRQLPEVASRTLRAAGETAGTLRERVAAGESRLNRDRIAVDVTKLRDSAQRGATAVAVGAVVAQEKAVTGYRHLVAHGEQVLATRTGASAPAEPEPAAVTAATTGSTAAGSTAAGSTAAGSTAAGSTAAGEAEQPTT